jgi:hypothetical protein
MISFDQFRGVDLVGWFPCVVTFGVPLPFDQILEPSRPAITSVVFDLLHLVLFFSSDKVRWGSGVVWAVDGVFMIRR